MKTGRGGMMAQEGCITAQQAAGMSRGRGGGRGRENFHFPNHLIRTIDKKGMVKVKRDIKKRGTKKYWWIKKGGQNLFSITVKHSVLLYSSIFNTVVLTQIDKNNNSVKVKLRQYAHRATN